MPNENLLQFEVSGDKELAVIELRGDLIAESRFELERVMRDWLELGVTKIIIGCEELNYIDSAGLSTLLGALHRLRRTGGGLLLTNMNPSLNAIFEVTSMQKFFKIFDTVEDARAYFDDPEGFEKKKAESGE